MADVDDSADNALLITELRLDTATEATALAAVRERLAVSLTAGHATAASERRTPSASTSVRRKFVAASRSGLLAALAVGTALGAAGHALVRAELERRAERDSAVEKSSVVAKKRDVLAPSAQMLPAALPAVPVSVASASSGVVTSAPTRPWLLPRAEIAQLEAVPSAAPGTSDSLEPELRQLDQARNAIAHGEPAQALATLAAHAQLHPSSILQQERDALTVKALVAAKRYAEARAAGDSFALRYPHSLLLDSVQHALGSIP